MSLAWDTLLEQQQATQPEFRPGALETRFVEPPFTVLDTRSGRWQERRRAWLSLGIRSELGRGAHANPVGASREGGLTDSLAGTLGKGLLSGATERTGFGADYDTSKGENAWGGSGTSIFDPVLCELAYRWWAPPGGSILDPFAGGSVRGIVAAKLGHTYTGIDLSHDQLEANRAQAQLILAPTEPMPHWHNGDSARMDALLPAGEQYDMIFSCPPYYDLEVYSDDPVDLSNMPWGGFMMAYDQIIEAACSRLRRERFAVFVVSEIRDPSGAYRGLVPYTIRSFQQAGLAYYNEAVLVNSVGSLPLRVTKYMEASRKLGRAHQNILVFLKGDAPRGWSYDRAAPPSPQLDLALLAEPEPTPAPPPLAALATIEPVDALSGATTEEAAPGPTVEGMSYDEPDEADEVLEDGTVVVDGYLIDAGTGEVLAPPEPALELEAPPQITYKAPVVVPAPELRAAEVAPGPRGAWDWCAPHGAGFHDGAIAAGACRAGQWWPGWPSVIPVGPPGSGRTPAPPPNSAPGAATTLWQSSDEQSEGGITHGEGQGTDAG